MGYFRAFVLLVLGVAMGAEVCAGVMAAPVIFGAGQWLGEGVLDRAQSGILMTQIFVKLGFLMMASAILGAVWAAFLVVSEWRNDGGAAGGAAGGAMSGGAGADTGGGVVGDNAGSGVMAGVSGRLKTGKVGATGRLKMRRGAAILGAIMAAICVGLVWFFVGIASPFIIEAQAAGTTTTAQFAHIHKMSETALKILLFIQLILFIFWSRQRPNS